MPILANFIKHSIEVLATGIRQENKTKGIQIRREIVKSSLFADGILVKTLKTSHKNYKN